MSKITRRETLARAGQAVAAAAVLPVIPTIALGASNDAVLVRMVKEVFRLVDEINAGLHSPDGEVSKEVSDRQWDLINAIADTPANGLEGVAVKLRLAMYEIGIDGNEDMPEGRSVLSALETVKRLSGGSL